MTRIRQSDRGSSLIIALAFLALFGLWVSATLASAENGLHIAQTMKVEPKRLYAADGAVEQLIQKIRYDQPRGVEGDTECGGEATLNGKTYFVQCLPSDGSGVSPNSGSSPNLGILAFSDGGGYVGDPPVPREFGFIQRKNGVIKVDGGLFSNAGVSFQNGSACPGTNCQQLNLCPNNAKKGVIGAAFAAPRTVTVPSFLLAPNPYDKFVNTATESDVGAPISGGSGSSTIPAGTKIVSVLGPSAVTTSANVSTTTNKTINFREDYPPTNKLCHPWDPASTHGDIRVMGSDCPEQWVVRVTFTCNISPTDPAHAALRALNPTDPHYPPDATTFTDRTVPACPAGRILEFEPGRYTDLAGLNNLTNGSACAHKVFHFKPGTYYFDFTVPNGVEPIWYLNNPQSWLIAGQRTWDSRGSDGSGIFFGRISQGTVILDKTEGPGFSSSTDLNKYLLGGIDVPVGAQVRQVNNSSRLTLKPLEKAPTVNVGSTNNPAMFALTTGSGQSAGCDNRTNVGNHPGAEFIFGGTSRLNVGDMRVEICAPAAGNDQQIAIYGVPDNNPYIPPGTLKKQTGCLKIQPYPANGCPFLYADPTRNPVLLIHGTVYAPDAVIDLTIKNLTYQVISRGLLARVVALEMFPNAQFTDPVIFSPNFGQVVGADREMLLTACENGSATSCAKPKLRALVGIQDHDDLNFTSVGYKVNVKSWTIVR